MIFPGSEVKLLKGLKLGCSGIITATCNVTAPLARKKFFFFQILRMLVIVEYQ